MYVWKTLVQLTTENGFFCMCLRLWGTVDVTGLKSALTNSQTKKSQDNGDDVSVYPNDTTLTV